MRTVYLAGPPGAWRDLVRKELDGLYLFDDPFLGRQTSVVEFVSHDLSRLTRANLVLAYRPNVEFPLDGLAAEIGIAWASSVPVYLVDVRNKLDGFLCGLARCIFTDLMRAVERLMEDAETAPNEAEIAKVEVTSFKLTGKYYTESLYEPKAHNYWDMLKEMRGLVESGPIPGLVEGAKDYHVLVTPLHHDGSHGVSHLFVKKEENGG